MKETTDAHGFTRVDETSYTQLINPRTEGVFPSPLPEKLCAFDYCDVEQGLGTWMSVQGQTLPVCEDHWLALRQVRILRLHPEPTLIPSNVTYEKRP